MSTQNNTKFDTLKIKKKKVLSTERQNGGDDTFLGTADKSAERHVVAMPMQDGVKTRSLKSTWLTAGPDTSKTKLLMPTLVKVVKDFPGKCSPEQLQSYIAKVFGDSTTASPAEITWKLKCTVKQVKIPPNGRSHAYCQGSVLPDGSAEIESMQKLRKDLKDHDIHVAVLHKTDVVEVSVPVRDIVIDVLVADPQKMVLILEVWAVKKEEEKKGNMRRMTSVTSSLNEPGDKFAGRAFCPLQGVQLEGEGRELPLYSHSKRHKRGELWVHLGYKPSQVADVSTAMMNYGHLFKLLAFHESSEQPGHVLMWSAKLSLQAMHLLRAQAILSGISDLQCIAMELGALLDYHEHYEVQWSIFLSLVERIETNLSEQPVPSQGSKQEWPPELHEQLKELSKCIQDRLYAHLCILGTAGEDDQKGVRKAAPGQQKEHPIAAVKGEQITLLQTLQKMYSFQPFVEQSGGTMEDCIKSPIEEWFRSSSSSASMQLPKGQSSKAPVLKAMAEACHDVCQLVQKYIVAVFKEFGVDYYSIFIQMIGSKLSELCTDCISKEKSLPPDRDTAIVYYLAYLVCRLIEKCASTVDPSLLDKLNIWRCYEPLVGSWIEAACIICKDRIQKAVESDTVVRVTDGACHSSSAVDVELFLHQALTFWKSLNWPDAEQAFGYALAHFQNICHCVEDYAKTIFKWVNTKDLSEKSFEMNKVEKVCIVFNNMAHLRNQLNMVSEKLDLESLYTRLTHGQNDAKKSFDRLRESTREDIEHKIVNFVEDYCKRLAPDIQSYITNIMATGHETDASLEALHDYLTKSLQAFGDYLLDEVFQIILARVWSTTLKCFQAALPDVEKGLKGQEQSSTLHLALLALLNFFFADGNGLSKENLENTRYKCLLTDLEHKCLATSDLVFKCCTQLSLRQPQTSTIGELFISARYVEEIPALVVHVSHAKLLSGVKKDGSADTFVQVWMIPQMVLQDAKSHYKTDIKKGTLTPTYDKDFQLPATTEDFKRVGAVLALAVYHTDTKHIAGLGLVPCQDIPVVRAQGSYVRTYTNKEWTLPLFLIQDTSSVTLRELLMRKTAHDSEATNFYIYLDKQLHVGLKADRIKIELKVDRIKTTSMTISWLPPYVVNSIIRGYQVSYTPHGESECLHDVGDTTSTELTSLKPHTEYTIRVRAKMGDFSTPITVTTLEEVPPPPIGLKADEIKTTSIALSWKSPHDINSIIRDYQVSYTPHGESECLHDVGDTTSTELTSLKPHTEYVIRVRAKMGDFSTPITVTTLEEGLFQKKISSILDNYKDITFKQLRIIKLIFYGTPRAGKTTLRKKLLTTVEDSLQPSSATLQPSTNIAEICDPVFVERIVMTNEENNVWRWAVQKLDDIAKALVLCLDNQLLHCEKEIVNVHVHVREEPNVTAAQSPTPVPLYVHNEQMASTPNLYVPPSQSVTEGEKDRVPKIILPSVEQDEISTSSTVPDIKQLFYEAVRTGQWSEVVSALNIDRAMLMQVIDGGGQPSFQEIFPLLISGPSLTLLMFKLTDDLQKTHDVQYQPIDGVEHTWKDTYVVQDFIFHAISSMVSNTGDTNNPFGCKILLVGTHKDEIKGSEDQKKAEIMKIAKSMHGWLRELKAFKSIHVKKVEDLVTGIDNFKQQDIQKVKNKIEELVSQTPSKDIPAPWLVFDFALHADAKSKQLRKVEKIQCEQIAKNCGVKDEEFEVVLKYLHYEAGTLLYYPDIPELRNCVITDFQLIFDSISKIIIDYFDDSSDHGPHLQDKHLLREKGQMEASVLKDVKGCLKVNELLSLMQHRHIISKMDGDMFFMPSVLPKAEPSYKISRDSCSFLVMFEHGCCPIGLFCAVTTRLIVTHKWRVKKDELQFRNKISLYYSCSGKSYHIIFSAFFAHYEICLIDIKAKPNIRCAIYKVIDEVFVTVCKDMDYPTPSYGFYCPKKCTYGGVTHSRNKHPAYCAFNMQAQEMTCYYSDSPSGLTEEHKSWFQEVQPQEWINVPPPPIGLKADRIKTTSTTISWKPPHNPKGIIRGYQVSYTPHGESECLHDVGDTTSTELTSLKLHTEHTIRVRAKTVDFGDYSTPITVITLEDVSISVVPSSSGQLLSEQIHAAAQAMSQLEGTPTMPELLSYSAEKLNIVIRVGAKYSRFGIFLLEDKTGTIVEALEVEHRGNAERINMAILQRWLQGKGMKPVTWSALIEVLRKIGI